MQERVWDKYLSDRDRSVFDAAGYGARAGFGERPALLVIDVNYNFCGDRPEPILESVKRWRLSCGEAAWEALPVLKKLIGSAHENGVPVIYTTGYERDDKWDRGSWSFKNARERADAPAPPPAASNRDGNDIMDEIAPGPRDLVVRKQKPSAFFEAPTLSYLNLLKADSVIVTGTTTSGCVRASAVDAFSHNLRVSVVEDACFDRSDVSHAISLLDLNAKYTDIVTADEVTAYFDGLEPDLFDLPKGNGG